MKLSIVIPLYNEERQILQLLGKVIAVELPDFVEEREIVIVDDYSTDASFDVVSEFIKDKPYISLYKHEKNQGKGAAVRTGFSKAKGKVYLIQDADLELDPRDIPGLIHAMKELNIEFINGSRYLSGMARPISSYKRFLANKFFTFLTSILIDVRLTDMACGYKLVHKDLVNKVSLKENRFGFEAEIIIKALRVKKNNVAEVPVQYFPRNYGEGKKLNNGDAFKILWTIFKYGVLRLN